jgi:hypothetical protein
MTEKKDRDINQATAALKGLLGIGGAPASEETSSQPKKNKNKTKIEPNVNQNKKSKSKKNGNKQKMNNASDEKAKQQQPPPPPPPPTSTETKKEKKDNDIYAWSAFQSSPDASALPIPAFLSPNKTELPVSSRVEQETVSSQIHEQKQYTTEQLDETQDTSFMREEEISPTISETGINLAAKLQATTPQQYSSQPSYQQQQYHHPYPPQQQYSHQQQQQQHYPQQQQHFSHHTPPAYPNYQQQQVPYYQPPPQPPHGYQMMQVQVPPNLGPDRTMLVTSPGGYPVQVVVPHGILPGTILPVHVPIPPHMMA